MAEFARKADGRRVFTVDFKRETFGRIVSGEKTLAELSRGLGISPSILRTWSSSPATPCSSNLSIHL
jgi:transposase-like protein